MHSEKNTVQVKIYGMDYSIKGGDPEYTLKVANYVDGKMLDMEKSMQSKSTLRVAILTAMNIADELIQAKEELQNMKEEIGERSKQLLDKVTSRISP